MRDSTVNIDNVIYVVTVDALKQGKSDREIVDQIYNALGAMKADYVELKRIAKIMKKAELDWMFTHRYQVLPYEDKWKEEREKIRKMLQEVKL